jgi:hypothetical protein
MFESTCILIIEKPGAMQKIQTSTAFKTYITKAAENVRTTVMLLLHIYQLHIFPKSASFQKPMLSVAGVCSLSQVRAFAML